MVGRRYLGSVHMSSEGYCHFPLITSDSKRNHFLKKTPYLWNLPQKRETVLSCTRSPAALEESFWTLKGSDARVAGRIKGLHPKNEPAGFKTKTPSSISIIAFISLLYDVRFVGVVIFTHVA